MEPDTGAWPNSTVFVGFRIRMIKFIASTFESFASDLGVTRQILAVPSFPAETSSWPSSENCTDHTAFQCPLSVASFSKGLAFLVADKSQNWMRWSSPPVASILPSGEKAKPITGPLWAWWVTAV